MDRSSSTRCRVGSVDSFQVRSKHMARTTVDKLAAADAIADRLANRNQDETIWRDAAPLHRIAGAFREQVAAEKKVAEAVEAARDKGYAWSAIATMLGVSKQTAQHRYGGARENAEERRAI